MRPPLRLGRILAVSACAWLLTSTAAAAAGPRYDFDIPAQPLGRALVALAAQGRISLSTTRMGACGPAAPALRGRFTLEEALGRMLAGSGCGYRSVAPGAFEIVPAPTARPAPVPAAPAPAPGPASLPELVVVATRRPTPADRLAYAVTTVGHDAIEAQGLRDSGDLALVTPAMTVTNLGAGRDKILLRGLSDGPLTGRTQSMVGIYLDDVRLTYDAPDPDLRLVDMAQVEVLRGPQGALYGSGSLGGVVHLVTNAADPGARSAWLSGSWSGTSGGAPSSVIEGMVNLPLARTGGAARIVAYREVSGGYIDDPALGLSDVNRSVRGGLRLNLLQPLGADWTLKAGFTGQSINALDTQYATEGGFERRNRVREPHDNDFAEAHLGARGDLGWSDAHVSLAVVRHRVSSRYDATSAPPVSAPPGPLAFDDDHSIASSVAEATLSAKPDARIQWLAGAFLARTRQRISLALRPLPAGQDAFDERRNDALDEAAVFGDLTLPLSHTLSLTLGGRAFASRNRARSLVTAPGAGAASPTAFEGSVSDSGFAPKVVLAFQPWPDLLAYVQAAEGYRAGGVNTTGAPGQTFSAAGGPEPERFYRADELWSFEAGVRARLLDGRLVARAAVFDAVWKDIQSDELLPSGLPFTGNIGDGVNRGLEFEATWREAGFELGGALLANDPELNRPNTAFATRLEPALAGVPGVSGSLTLRRVWTVRDDLALSLDGRVAYVGPSHLTFDAQTSPRMGGYVTGRIAAALSGDRWRLSLAVENPGDVRGNTFAYGNPFTLRTQPQAAPLRPRTVSVTVSRRFGS